MGALIVLAITFALMWVLFILPQQRRVKAHQALVGRLAVGDDVVTSTGIYGTITALDDEIATLEIAPGTQVRFARGAVAQRVAEITAAGTAGTAKKPTSRPAGTAADRAHAPVDIKKAPTGATPADPATRRLAPPGQRRRLGRPGSAGKDTAASGAATADPPDRSAADPT